MKFTVKVVTESVCTLSTLSLHGLVMVAGMETERFPWEQTCHREAQLSVWCTGQI